MSETKHHLQRTLGLFDATSIVAGSMIGSGIFIVTSTMAKDIGSAAWILVLWLVTGLLTMTAALSYGELAGMMPKAGGQFVYIQRAYGRMVSFLYGWTVFTVIQTGVIAAVAVAFAKYTAVFFPELNIKIFAIGESWDFTYKQVLAMASVVLLTYINTKGVKTGKTIQVVFTSAKLIALFSIIILGLYFGLKTNIISENFTDMWHATRTIVDKVDGKVLSVTELTGFALIGVMGATIINPLFSSDAWNNVTFIAGEIKEPQKNIPRSLFLGTLIVTVIYILANIAYMSLLPVDGIAEGATVIEKGIKFADQERVGAAAASVIMGNIGVFVMAGLIMVSTFGCNSGLVLSGGRLFYAMSKDGLFFKKAGELNKHDVPAKALWFQCLWACVLCISGRYNDLVNYCTFASLLFYMLTIYGIFILRKKEPDAERPYKAFGYPVIPVLYILVTAAICVALLIFDTVNTTAGLIIVGLGVPVYYIFMNKKVA
ncbi:APC family permease [Flavobacterium pallidum]|uniref:Amino acid transporter n=1 Tax=Flavobacterium pallidum TaxID=2172098 RepID=A0A2S1SKW2_9FLAO|nr:amino acid permease [Flavobacterium pallidum]AWI27050.1 amino acid transporter [Flavobacterium pallidum]